MINKAILMGRLTADPELKTTNTGVSVTSFTIAVDRSYVKQGEERKADFINIVCWRSTAEFVCRYFGKGSLIAVEGQLQSRQFQAKDGSNRYVVEVVADNVSFTGEKRENNQQQNYQQGYQQQNYQQGYQQQGYNNYPANGQQYQQAPQQPPQYQQAPQPQRPPQPQQGYTQQGYVPNPSYQQGFADMPTDDDLPF